MSPSGRTIAQPPLRPTLADVARRAGVSTATVSRAINAPAMVAEDTVTRVRAAIATTGYVPNLLAGGLASSRNRFVAALVPSIAVSVFNETIESMSRALAESGYLVMLALLNEGPGHAATLDAVLGRRPEGIILTSIEQDAETRQKLRQSGASIIETWALPREPIDLAVGFSHADVGRDLARHLHAKGYVRPLLLAMNFIRSRERAAAFSRTWRRLTGYTPDLALAEGARRHEPVRMAVAEKLDAKHPPDIVVCSSDWLADAVLVEARSRGLQTPGELGVFGFGDGQGSADWTLRLSTVRIDGAAIGERAAAMLLDRAAGRDIQTARVDVGFEILDRESA